MRRQFIAWAEPGPALTRKTIETLVALARRRSTHPEIRRRAAQLVADIDPRDQLGQLQAIFEWVAAVPYVRDPVGVEHITDPLELDRQLDDPGALVGEDCEGLAAYAAALLLAIGIRPEFETQGPTPDDMRHAALVVRGGGSGGAEIAFDTVGRVTRPGWGLGDTMARGRYLERYEADTGRRVYRDASGRAVLAGLFGDPIDTNTAIRQGIKGAANVADLFGPWGGVVGGVLRLGGNVYDAAAPPEPGPRGGATGSTTRQRPRPVGTILGGGGAARTVLARDVVPGATPSGNTSGSNTVRNVVVGGVAGLLLAKLFGVI